MARKSILRLGGHPLDSVKTLRDARTTLIDYLGVLPVRRALADIRDIVGGVILPLSSPKIVDYKHFRGILG